MLLCADEWVVDVWSRCVIQAKVDADVPIWVAKRSDLICQ